MRITCINSEGARGITVGKTYTIAGKSTHSSYVLIKNDYGDTKSYFRDRFEDARDDTQVTFDNLLSVSSGGGSTR